MGIIESQGVAVVLVARPFVPGPRVESIEADRIPGIEPDEGIGTRHAVEGGLGLPQGP
ncbi:hypothetical protein ACFL41_02710 [Gemmatimonadota bacterium]